MPKLHKGRHIAALLVIAVTAAIAGSAARADSTISVTPLNLSAQGFEVVSDDGTVPVIGGNSTNQRGLVTGPATPPLGSGSYEMKTATLSGTAPRSREGLYLQSAAGKTIGHLTDLGYSSYEPASNPQTNGPVIAIGVTDPSINAVGHVGEHYTALVYDPAINGFSNPSPIAKGVWQTWSPFNTDSRWYCTRTFTIGTLQCNAGQKSNSTVTWAQIQANIPTATINGDGIQLASGSTGTSNGYDGFETFIDAFIVGFDGNSTTYNFESPAPDTVYVDGSYTSSSAGGHVFGYNAFATIQPGVNAAASCGTVYVAAGTYSENPTLNSCVTLLGAQAGNNTGTRSGSETTVSSFDITSSNVVVDGFKFNAAGPQLRAEALSGPALSGVIARHDIFDGYQSVGVPTYNAGIILLDDVLFKNPSGSAEAIQIKADASTPGGCSGTQVKNATFDHATNNGGADINLSCTGSDSSGITITNPVSTGDSGGSSLIGLSGVTGVTVVNPTATTDGSSIFVFGDITGTLLIQGGSLTSTSGKAVSIHASDITTDPVNSGVIDVEGTNLTGSPALSVSAGAVNASSQVKIHGSKITGGVQNSASSVMTVDATGNGWGSVSGPGTLSGVNTKPWYTDDGQTLLSNNADLTSLSLTGVTLSPAFSPSTTAYTASVNNGVSSIDVSKTVNPGASAVVNGASSLTVSLAVGNNNVKVKVTSADGTVKTYTITVNRAAATPAPPANNPPPTTTTTKGTETTTVTPTSVAVTQTGTNQAATTPVVQPTQSGAAIVVVQPTTGSTTSSSVSVQTTWQPGTFTTPVTVSVAPKPELAAPAGGTTPPPAAGFKFGSSTLQLTVTAIDPTTGTTVAVHQFSKPLTMCFSTSEAGEAPAYSPDGNAPWTFIPQLSSSNLPESQQDGYYRDTAAGTTCIYTRHATFFGLLKDAKTPTIQSVKAHLVGSKLYITTHATDNVRVAYYLVSITGGQAFKTTHPNVTRKVRKGHVTVKVTVVDTAGNKKTSATIKAR